MEIEAIRIRINLTRYSDDDFKIVNAQSLEYNRMHGLVCDAIFSANVEILEPSGVSYDSIRNAWAECVIQSVFVCITRSVIEYIEFLDHVVFNGRQKRLGIQFAVVQRVPRHRVRYERTHAECLERTPALFGRAQIVVFFQEFPEPVEYVRLSP